MNVIKNNAKGSQKYSWSLYLSLIFGGVSWTIILLNFTPVLGNSFGRIFCFVPPAILGLAAGFISLFGPANKKMAGVAICLNSLAIVVLLVIMVLLINGGGFRE